MQQDSEIQYKVTLVRLKPGADPKQFAVSLARALKNAPPDKILARIESLPWTLTRKANAKNASRLKRLLHKLGAETTVNPPLPEIEGAQETQVLSETRIYPETIIPTDTIQETERRSIDPEEVKQAEKRVIPPVVSKPQIRPLENDVLKPPSEKANKVETRYSLDPLSIGEMLDRTFQIFKKYFLKLLGIMAVVWLAGLILSVGIIAFVVFFGVGAAMMSVKYSTAMIILLAVIFVPLIVVVFTVFMNLSQAAMTYCVSSIYLGQEPSIKECYSFAWKKIFKLVLTQLVAFGLTLVILILCGVAGVAVYFLLKAITDSGFLIAFVAVPIWIALAMVPFYFILKLMLMDKVVVIEDEGYLEALKRSWDLLSGKIQDEFPKNTFTRFMILMSVFSLISLAVGIVVQVPGKLLSLALPEYAGLILDQLLSYGAQIISGIFWAAGTVIFYYDIRIRREGFDLQILTNQLLQEQSTYKR